jgi:3-oxoacyl-(acyl-carrier-protein) synthase
MASSTVVITGFGVVSPLGASVSEVTRRFCAGESAVGALAGMEADGVLGAVVGDIALQAVPADAIPRIGRLDRICRLFVAAAFGAADAAGLDMAVEDPERIGLSFGTGLGCLLTNAEYYQKILESGLAAASPRLFAYTVSSAAAGEVSIALGIKGASVTMHAGFAAGLQAIGYGCDLIHAGKADVVLAGGADALGGALLSGLADMGLLKRTAARPFRDASPGVHPAEAAVVAVLESRERALRRGAHVWARIAGYAAGFEPTLTHDTPDITGIQATLQRALSASGYGWQDVALVLTSAHGTALDAIEGAAIARLCARGAAPLLFAPKQAWGECFAASGPQAVGLAAGLLREPPATLADGLAFEIEETRVRAATDPLPRLRRAAVAMVHSLCYSGNTVALLLGREG